VAGHGGDPATFARDAMTGFAAAYSRYVQPVPGASAVMRSGGPTPGKVAVIGGGGSGHYPAFMGLVGPGLLDGAVVGEVFTSPSAEQAYRAGRALDAGAGVLFSYGNYAGDRLNFDLAQDRLIDEGIDCRTVVVTDDVASGPPEDAGLRRGVAGDLVVFKVAGAAAEQGLALDEVERLARRANDATRTIGVAFGGCVLPGAADPLFTVADGMIEIGLGIHGEPGVRAVERPGPPGLAEIMVEALLPERPEGARRVAVLLNGLGATKYEELFRLWHHLGPLLEKAGLEPVAPEVGELVTSLDMPGCSLTITWLDAELERFWLAPADTPAFRRAGPVPGPDATVAIAPAAAGRTAAPPRAKAAAAPLHTADDRDPSAAATGDQDVVPDPAAQTAQLALAGMLAVVQASEAELGRLDAVAGDGDHGSGMVRGISAAAEAARDAVASGTGLGPTLQLAGAAWADRGGGTSGVLWGLLLDELGASLTGGPADARSVATAVGLATARIGQRGGARVGDKTLLDALVPFAEALQAAADSGTPLAPAWQAAAVVAAESARATAGLVARAGRARALAERALGSPDPGAISMSLCLGAVSAVLSARCPDQDRQERP
jgi:dihydroxyacetone kinase